MPVELPDSAGGASSNDDTFEEDFLRSLPSYVDDDNGGILDDGGLADPTDNSPTLNRSLFNDGIAETPTNARAVVNDAAAALTNLASFPSSFGTLPNRFTNQNSALNDEGYDSEGNLPHVADEPNDNMEEYFEETIVEGRGGGEAAVAAMMAVANEAHQLDVMRLSVAQLKAELRKRGRGTGGNKSAMQVRLKEAIDLNVPVLEESGGNEARRPDFMTGLDVMAKWELLTRCDDPIRRKSPTRSNMKSNAEKRSQRVDTQALSPSRGRLRSRLAPTGHMPVAAKGIHVCQLHRWAYKEFNPGEPDNAKPKGSRASVMRCRECDVHLCINCFEIFHTSERLRPMIPRILGLPD